jgi:hypothetical protein
MFQRFNKRKVKILRIEQTTFMDCLLHGKVGNAVRTYVHLYLKLATLTVADNLMEFKLVQVCSVGYGSVSIYKLQTLLSVVTFRVGYSEGNRLSMINSSRNFLLLAEFKLIFTPLTNFHC